jgi:predicted transposase YbfD/YdcC
MTATLTKQYSIAEHFGSIKDARYQHSPPHRLLDIITIALCAVICGANDWEAVAEFGRTKEDWLRKFLPLAHGIPSADTFGRIFSQIDPVEFEHSFINWVEALSELTPGEVVAIDGKTLRRSHDHRHDQKAIHMVSAWASQNRLVLGQVKVDDKSNEITAIPALLRLLALQGCIVTIDAMGHQTEIAAQIIKQGADYALALKENQGHLYHEVVRLFTDALADPTGRAISYATDRTVNKGHGRLEIRQCWTISQPDFIKYLDPQGRWAGLKTVVMIESHRSQGDQHTHEVRYYTSSLAGDPKLLNRVC